MEDLIRWWSAHPQRMLSIQFDMDGYLHVLLRDERPCFVSARIRKGELIEFEIISKRLLHEIAKPIESLTDVS